MKQQTICNIAFGMVLAVIVAPLAYWIGDRSPPFERNNGYIAPENPRPGDEVNVVWNARFVRDCPGIILRTITDSKGDIYTLPSSVARYAERRAVPQILSTFKLSPNIACGPALYEADAKYVCNWTQIWWPIRVNRPVIRFNVACP